MCISCVMIYAFKEPYMYQHTISHNLKTNLFKSRFFEERSTEIKYSWFFLHKYFSVQFLLFAVDN